MKVRRNRIVAALAGLIAIAAFAAIRSGNEAECSRLAEQMILIENEAEYVTTFTTMLLSDAASRAISDRMRVSGLTQAQTDTIHAVFNTVALRNPHTGEAYVFLRIAGGGPLGAVLFSDSDSSVTLSDEMIALCGQDRDMLAGLLMHELAHRDLKHSRIRLIGAARSEDRPDLIHEDYEKVAQSYTSDPERLLGFTFGAKMESAARAHADEMLREKGLKTGDFERCLSILEANNDMPGVDAFLKAHSLERGDPG